MTQDIAALGSVLCRPSSIICVGLALTMPVLALAQGPGGSSEHFRPSAQQTPSERRAMPTRRAQSGCDVQVKNPRDKSALCKAILLACGQEWYIIRCGPMIPLIF